jgi:PRC-barrel domain
VSKEVNVAIDRHILVGRDVYTRDGMRVGEVRRVSGDAEFVIVDRPLSGDLLLPMDELHEIGGRLEIQRTLSYLDDAPEVDSERMTLDDRQRLEEFYRTRAA